MIKTEADVLKIGRHVGSQPVEEEGVWGGERRVGHATHNVLHHPQHLLLLLVQDTKVSF